MLIIGNCKSSDTISLMKTFKDFNELKEKGQHADAARIDVTTENFLRATEGTEPIDTYIHKLNCTNTAVDRDIKYETNSPSSQDSHLSRSAERHSHEIHTSDLREKAYYCIQRISKNPTSNEITKRTLAEKISEIQ